MKTQVISKKLLLPFIFIEIAATAIGMSFPAQATSLINFQSKVNNTNPETTLIAKRPKYQCQPPVVNPSHCNDPDPWKHQVEIKQQHEIPQQQSLTAEPLPTAESSLTTEPLPTAKPLPNAEPAPASKPSH